MILPIHLYIVLAAAAAGQKELDPKHLHKSLEFVFSNTLCVITGLLYINDVDDHHHQLKHLWMTSTVYFLNM